MKSAFKIVLEASVVFGYRREVEGLNSRLCLHGASCGHHAFCLGREGTEEDKHTESRVRWKSAMLTTVVSESGSCALRAILAQGGYASWYVRDSKYALLC